MNSGELTMKGSKRMAEKYGRNEVGKVFLKEKFLAY
jgi:hypothetical protein